MPNATVSPETAPETEDNPVEPPTGGNAEPKKPKNKRNKNKKKGVTPDSVTPTKPVESTELSATEPGAAETDRTDLKKSKKKKPKTESGQNSSDLKIDGAEAAKKPKKKEIKLISKEDIDQPSQSKVVLTDKEKEYLNQQTLKQLNEERFAKIRQTMVDSGMPQEKIDQKFLRVSTVATSLTRIPYPAPFNKTSGIVLSPVFKPVSWPSPFCSHFPAILGLNKLTILLMIKFYSDSQGNLQETVRDRLSALS